MKATTLSLLAGAALAPTVLATVSLDIAKNPAVRRSPQQQRQIQQRATITESLANNYTGGSYVATVQVGTPPQTQTLVIDTGSSDVWLLSADANLCTSEFLQNEYGGGCSTTFDSSKSSTFKVVSEGTFDIQYQDNSGSSGDYVSDNFKIGGITVKALQMGLANDTTVPTGLMGIGYDTNEAARRIYPNLIDDMASQGLVTKKAYSLFLNDLNAATGSIIFGGIDTEKFHGSLVALPIIPDQAFDGSDVFAEFNVPLTGLDVTFSSKNSTTVSTSSLNDTVILDSGTSITYLPDTLAADLYDVIGAIDDTEMSGNTYVDCDLLSQFPDMTFDFTIGGSARISVPIYELVFDLTGIFTAFPPDGLPFDNVCAFGIQPALGGPNLFGDTFLRSAYVVYDLEDNQVALAQTNFGSTKSNIVEFKTTDHSIPALAGVSAAAEPRPTQTIPFGATASSEAPTPTPSSNDDGNEPGTASGTGGDDGGDGSSSSGTGSGSTSTPTSGGRSSSSPNAGIATVPPMGWSGLMVFGVSLGFAVLGGGLILA
ncbi:aspartic peptidase domain-containing protein [Xylogone sp. PMI_703]|nr:aspartic peptidase domain-containing protein [Xylogone sp. PMI_703]